ncbi:MAG: nucleotidyltransferase family protein [Actinomycetota bacterium]|nr:nucleotidyltransferase family protein [Actinomycetota bacterium]
MPRVAALLAAGSGSRFHGPQHKLLATLHGRPVWEWALHQVLAADFDFVVVVTGAVELTLPPAAGLINRHNPQWQLGQAGSVLEAIDAAHGLGAHEVTIGLADQPFVTAAAWRAVATAEPECHIVIATYDGVPGPNPVRLDRAVWPLLPTDGDAGARHLIREHPEWVCPVPCVGSVADIDTLEDLERWKNC